MCTVTVVPTVDGFRMRCNRDERRDRTYALPPILHTQPHRRAILPTDPAGPGSWIGVNDAGIAAALLNRTLDSAEPIDSEVQHSRGLIVPKLLDCASLAEAIAVASRLNLREFNPFRIVVVQGAAAAVATSDGAGMSVESTTLSRPMMLTSSSLGDALVERPRRTLFDRMFSGEQPTWLPAQGRFHRHQWTRRREISVRMERGDALTVSHTVVRVNSNAIELRYRARDGARPVAIRADLAC